MALILEKLFGQTDVLKRFKKDELTEMRLKYGPYYNTFDRQVGCHVWQKDRELIMLSSNDYLGLCDHPKVIAAGKKALDVWGSSTTGARLSNGSRRYHLELEEALAAFLGKEACHVSAAGYLSCMAAVASFVQREDLILSDRNNHSSLCAGISQTRARVERFAHNNVEDLKEALSFEEKKTPKFLVVEGVYSMEGHICRLPEFLEAVKGQNAMVILDDAHGFGVLGREGRGTPDHFGVTEEVDVICGSLSKSLGSTGGFVAGSRDVIEYLRTHSKQMIFSAAIAPVQAACAQAALEVMQGESEHLERLWANTRAYKEILANLELDTWGSESPAVPIVLGSKPKAYYFWKALLDAGIFTVMSIAPAVPPGKDLVRTAISAKHSEADLKKIEDALYKAKKAVS